MARKVINRKELRAENDAAERIEGEAAPAKKKRSAKATNPDGTPKVPVKRKSRAKTAKEVRLKAFWAVYSQSMKCVAKFEYSEQAQAKTKAEEMSVSAKSPHFVQLLKEPVTE